MIPLAPELPAEEESSGISLRVVLAAAVEENEQRPWESG